DSGEPVAGSDVPSNLAHLKYELAAEVAVFADAMRVGGWRQRKERDVRRAHRGGKDELTNALERRTGASDRRPQRGHVVPLRLRRRRPGSDKGGAAARPQPRKRSGRHLAADQRSRKGGFMPRLKEMSM